MSQPDFIRGWLSDHEFEFKKLLKPISLVIEANIDENLLATASEFFGKHISVLHRVHRYSGGEIAKKYPALTLISMVGHAATDYERNTYWDGYWARLGLDREQTLENEFRRAIPELLERFKLAEFPELEGKYVQQLAMHAGIPNYCLRGVVEAIGEHLAWGREPTGPALIEWLLDPAKPHRLNILNVPARNFIRDGGEFALDIIDRIIELVEFYADNSASWQELVDAGEITTETTGLPSLMLDGLLDILDSQDAAELIPTDRVARRSVGGAPYLELDTMEDTIQVCLPHPGEEFRPDWSVSLDGAVTLVEGAIGWGAAESQPPTRTPVTSPVRSVSVTHELADRRYTLPLVDPAAPLLVFTDTGSLIPRRQPLPIGYVYAALPKRHELAAGSTMEVLEPEVDLGVPGGWRQWRLVTISTVELRSLQLVDENGQRVGAARMVRNSHLPELELDPEIRGVTTVNGARVHATRPSVRLPRHPAGEPITWQVSARRIGTREWFAQQFFELGIDDAIVDPFAEAAMGLLGSFEVLVRGPLGSDLRRVVHLAEGLEVELDGPFRYPAGGGLSSAKVLLSGGGALMLSENALDFDAATRQRLVTARSGETREQLVVSPPHLEFRLDTVGDVPRWSAFPLVATVEEFTDNKLIAVRVPAEEASVYIELVDAEREVRQAEEPRYRENSDAFGVVAVRFTDTIRSMGAGQVLLTVESPGHPAVAVPVVHVRPTQLCQKMILVDGLVTFTGLAPISGLALQVWCEAAPWRRPQTLPVSNAEVALPEDLRDVGPLLVTLMVHDPWSTVPPSSTPGPDAVRLIQFGWVRDREIGLEQLSRLLVGRQGDTQFAAGRPELWSAYAMHALNGTTDSDVKNVLKALLLRDPRTSIESLAASTVPAGVQAGLIVRSGLAWQDMSAHGVWTEVNANPWGACMGALADLPNLPFGSERREEAVAAARRQGGDALVRIARTGNDPYSSSGLFDGASVALDAMPAIQVDQIFELASIVPSELLERDTRVTALAEAFAMRHRWARSSASQVLPELVGFRAKSVQRVSRKVYANIQVRNEALDGVAISKHPWITLPLMSISIAVLARMQAHRVKQVPPLTPVMATAWAEMARLCPKLVLSDLLLAEALVAHHLHGNLLGELDV